MAVIVMQQPPSYSCDNLIGWGISSSVYYDKRQNEAIKASNDSDFRHFIEIEKEIYERLCEDSQHDGLLQYRGSEIFGNDYRTVIRLEWAPNGQLDRFLKDNCNEVDGNMQIRWITQLAEVLKYVHSKGVMHGDIACYKILLDEHLNAKLIDFTGSSIDGSTFLISCSFRAQPPWPSTPQMADIFAFGSACYHILMRHLPFHELSEEEVEQCYEQGIFPELECLGDFGAIIRGCWNGKYDSMDGIIKDIGKQDICIEKDFSDHLNSFTVSGKTPPLTALRHFLQVLKAFLPMSMISHPSLDNLKAFLSRFALSRLLNGYWH